MTHERAPRLVIATSNAGKAREYRALIGGDLDVRTAADLDLTIASETGSTFSENAALKAIGLSRGCDGLVIADDSGLEVDALSGEPGVRSARYAGEPSDDRNNVSLLLSNLNDVPMDARTARFRCVIAVARHGELLLTTEGVCDGTIALEPRGSFGFGYDPVFQREDGRTMAELPAAEKNQVSHRARAFAAIATPLRELLDVEQSAGGGKR